MSVNQITTDQCSTCNREFKTPGACARHQKYCSLYDKVMCDKCGVFYSRRGFRQHKWLTCPKRDAAARWLTRPAPATAANEKVLTVNEVLEWNAPPPECDSAPTLKKLSDDVKKSLDLHTGLELEVQIATDEAALLRAELYGMQEALNSATSELNAHRVCLQDALSQLRAIRAHVGLK